MKISYKVLKRLVPKIKTPLETAQDLIMHTAEVEEIITQAENLKDVIIWEILDVKKHPETDRLNLCRVKVNSEEKQIVCWAPNVKAWIKVPVAIVGVKLSEDFIIQKTKIRGEASEGMICSEDELWLIEERQNWIMILPEDAKIWVSMREYLWFDDIILEIDNKAINHRPDLFSHVWVAREIEAINGKEIDFTYKNKDFKWLKDLWIKNKIPELVKRYIWLKVIGVKNVESPKYIKEVLNSNETTSKWLLVDITNYCLYFYWQPTHCFDADKIKGKIEVRLAKIWEKFTALNKEEYILEKDDIVIADDEWVIALWGVIWWLNSAVTDETKNTIIESAHFDQATIRKTAKRLWIRTDALNVFEKDISLEIQNLAVSLIVEELEKNINNLKLDWFSDIYPKKQEKIEIDFDLSFTNRLIGKNYKENEAIKILENLWIEKKWKKLKVPFWRKDLSTKADIAEEIVRIDWYDKIESTIPIINLWAIIQDNMYKLKNDTRIFLVNLGFFDLYNYSFVNEKLMKKLESDSKELIDLKNSLSEDATHMKDSLIPNLMLSLEKNIKNEKNLRLFEVEKVFKKTDNEICENYEISWVMTSGNEIVYYETQNILSNLLTKLWVKNFFFKNKEDVPSFAHPWRTAGIVIKGKEVWYVWEIHPSIAKRFDIESRVWFFTINAVLIEKAIYELVKAEEVSNFQENNFDLSFIVDKTSKWRDIFLSIKKSDENLIKKVELFDIYEDENKLPWKRSLSFKIFIQSTKNTLNDKIKNEIIEKIVKKVEKNWAKLR